MDTEPIKLNPSTGAEFHKHISIAKAANPHGDAVYVYEPHEYDQMKTFLTPDKSAGFALKGDDVVSLFKHPDSPVKQWGERGMEEAIKRGGRTADAFDTNLPHKYATAGMRVVSRIPFDPDEAPEGWNKSHQFDKYRGGKPDVVFMAFDPASIGKPYRGRGTGARIRQGKPLDYGQAVNIQQKTADKISRRNDAFGEGSQSGR